MFFKKINTGYYLIVISSKGFASLFLKRKKLFFPVQQNETCHTDYSINYEDIFFPVFSSVYFIAVSLIPFLLRIKPLQHELSPLLLSKCRQFQSI